MSELNDDRLTNLLGQLRHERMDRVADDKIRARLENAWTAREQQRGLGWGMRRFAPVLATIFLVVGLSGATMNASGDSVLYGVRVAVEDAAVALHTDPEDRNEYLLSLLEQRQDEAARLESSGNALAASHVRQVEQQTLQQLMAKLPQAPDDAAAVQPAPTETPSPAPSLPPSPSPMPSPTPEPTAARTATPTEPVHTPTPTTRPSPTPTPFRTASPTPTPTGSPMAVTISGVIKNADGSLASGVCILTSSVSGCINAPADQTGGTYRIVISARINQTFPLYFMRTDTATGITWKGSTTIVVKGPTVVATTVTLSK
ncbi:MAG TPA: DUF5667 domain-containing protein [Candidatus Acidoferrales bacterium]|nr:DUF5667 domain-containing protein [Candidatus Acidoferrales bacterium]